jgi:hypothetical protein
MDKAADSTWSAIDVERRGRRDVVWTENCNREALAEAHIEARMLLVPAGMCQALRMCEDPISQAHDASMQQPTAGWAL